MNGEASSSTTSPGSTAILVSRLHRLVAEYLQLERGFAGISAGLGVALARLSELGDDEGLARVRSVLGEHFEITDLPE